MSARTHPGPRRAGGACVVLLALLHAAPSLACPTCFASTDAFLLRTYYASALFLTCMPFVAIGAVALWLARRTRQHRPIPLEASDAP